MKVFTLAIFGYIQKEYNHIYDDLIKEEKLTQTEIDVLAFLYNNPEYKHARDIVEVRRITKAQASIAVDKLVKKGYLSREVDEQCRRCHILKLQDAAMPVLGKIIQLQSAFENQMYANLTEEELETFLLLLDKVGKNIK